MELEFHFKSHQSSSLHSYVKGKLFFNLCFIEILWFFGHFDVEFLKFIIIKNMTKSCNI